MSTFENGQKRRKVDVLGAGCVNKRCCIWETLHRIKFSEHYDVPFFCYLGLKWPMFSSLLFIYYNMFASNACGTVGLLGEACYDLDNSTGNNIVI